MRPFISGTTRGGGRKALNAGVFVTVFSTSESDFGVLALAKMLEVADNSGLIEYPNPLPSNRPLVDHRPYGE